MSVCVVCFFFKQKTAYEIRIRDWSSDVCFSDLAVVHLRGRRTGSAGDGSGLRDGLRGRAFWSWRHPGRLRCVQDAAFSLGPWCDADPAPALARPVILRSHQQRSALSLSHRLVFLVCRFTAFGFPDDFVVVAGGPVGVARRVLLSATVVSVP